MVEFHTKSKAFSGTTYSELAKKARTHYKKVTSNTKRRPYIRSKFFNKQRKFLELYWVHLSDKKSFSEKVKRLRYFACGIELIKKSHCDPISKENPNNTREIVHRFIGIDSEKKRFCVQIKEEKNSGEKWLMSIFPCK
jgi:hypothetical protein